MRWMTCSLIIVTVALPWVPFAIVGPIARQILPRFGQEFVIYVTDRSAANRDARMTTRLAGRKEAFVRWNIALPAPRRFLRLTPQATTAAHDRDADLAFRWLPQSSLWQHWSLLQDLLKHSNLIRTYEQLTLYGKTWSMMGP